jgi:hypothetical protein
MNHMLLVTLVLNNLPKPVTSRYHRTIIVAKRKNNIGRDVGDVISTAGFRKGKLKLSGWKGNSKSEFQDAPNRGPTRPPA